MKKIVTFLVVLLFPVMIWAQSPQKISYQTVIRNSNNELVTNQNIGMQISILQGSADGTAVYAETQTPTTNTNGLASVEIGNGTLVSGDFASIDWAYGPYFIKTETDPEGGTNYTLTGTSQLLSVPYALFAESAESITDTIAETDAEFSNSPAANISETDLTNLGNLSGVNTGDQDLSDLVTNTDLSTATTQIRSEIPDLSGFITSESDPVFTNSSAAKISASNLANLGNLSGINSGDQDLSALATKSALADSTAKIRSEIPDVSGILSSETDPEFTAWDKSTGISITENQITDLNHFTNDDETDPVYSSSVAGAITASDITGWNNKPDAEVDGDVTNEIQDLTSVLAQGSDAGAKQIKNIATPTDSSDANTKAYVDRMIIGLFEDNYDTTTVMDFSVSDTAVYLNRPVTFYDNSSLVLDPTWLWDFGDGNTSTEQNPTHSYTKEGCFTVSLTASFSEFNISYTETKTDYVCVTNPTIVSSFTDSRDGQLYKTVEIGNQVWMAENLKYLPAVVGPDSISNTTPFYYVYAYDGTDIDQAKQTDNYKTYGVLYNWPAAMNESASSSANPSGVQGACPEGWHLPSNDEWIELIDFVGGESVAGGSLKEMGTEHWISPNTGAYNDWGFTALPGGILGSTFSLIGKYGFWWTATSPWFCGMVNYSSQIYDDGAAIYQGFSVRCVKD